MPSIWLWGGLIKVSSSASPPAQGCIKLGLARASAGGREVFASLSAGQPNPEGWQMVANT
jgi:hypothetical protein